MKNTTLKVSRATRPATARKPVAITNAITERLGQPSETVSTLHMIDPRKTLAPGFAEAQAGRATAITLSGNQLIELESYVAETAQGEKSVPRFFEWTISLATTDIAPDGSHITDVSVSARYSDLHDPNLHNNTVALFSILGGYVSVAEFRKILGGLNALAAQLPDTARSGLGEGAR